MPRSVLMGRTPIAAHDTRLGSDGDANVQITAGWVETPAGVLVPARSQPASGEALAAHHPGAVAYAVDVDDTVRPVSYDDPMPVDDARSATAASTAVNVATSSTSVAAANAGRLQIDVVNDSDTVIYLKLGTGATANSGIRLNAHGGSWSSTRYTGAVTAIHAGSGSKVLTVSEVG